MKDEHLKRAVLERFVDGALPSEEARQIEQHLAICSDCWEKADQVSLLAKLQVLDSWLHPGYDDAFERAAVGTAERLESLLIEARSTEDLLGELLREVAQLRHFKIRNEERFHSLKLCQLLQKRSRENWFHDSAAALELADLAVVVAQYLDPGRYGSSLVEDSRALSLAYLGNAFRVTSDLWRAEQALQLAWIHYLQAGGDLSTETEILSLTCSLRGTQGRLDEAEKLSERVIDLHREAQNCHLEGAALVHKALILGYGYRFEEAIPLAYAGLSRMSVERDVQLVLVGRCNLIFFLSRFGEQEQARRVLNESRFLFDGQGNRRAATLQWLKGLIARGFGRFAEAESLLLGLRDFLVQCHYGAETFSASFDLADMYMQIGQCRKAKEILREVIPLGEALELRRDVFLARLLYDQASRS